MKTKSDQQQEPVRLTGGSVIGGVYYAVGEPTPFASESEVPENVETLYRSRLVGDPVEADSNIYDRSNRGRNLARRGFIIKPLAAGNGGGKR